MVVEGGICYASDIVEYDGKTPDLSNTLLHKKQEHHQYREKHH